MTQPPGDDDDGTQRSNLLLFAVFIVIVAVGFLIVWKLHEDLQLQNCLISGRRDCAPVEIPDDSR
jgi:hypothetical protein